MFTILDRVVDKKRWFINTLAIAIITVIFLLSFRSFATYLAPNFNSDHAIHVLMTYHLKLPKDLYYWGQNRLGSIVPILAHLLIKSFPISPVEAVSYVQYVFLLIGFICFTSLFKHILSKIIFALVWFLPTTDFIELVNIGQPYAAQLCLIGLTILCIDQVLNHGKCWPAWRKQAAIAIATFSLMTALWVSDFTIVTLFLLGVMALRYTYQFYRNAPISSKEKLIAILPGFLNITFFLFAGEVFINYAKENASRHQEYNTFNSVVITFEVLKTLITSLFQTLTFQTKDFFLSIQAIFAVLFVLYAINLICRNQTRIVPNLSRWFYFFFIHAILGFLLLICSNWVYINLISLRYFVVVYVTGWLSALLFVEALEPKFLKQVYILLIVAALSSSLTLPPYVFSIQKARPRIQALQDMQSLGKVGIIGDYWTAYLICSVNPKQLNCTSYDPRASTPCLPPGTPEQVMRRARRIRGVRCSRCVSKVMKAETIYLVKNKWLQTFPPQTQQFGHCLIQIGEPKKIAGYTLAPYRKVDLSE
jgi:hypothetical protein